MAECNGTCWTVCGSSGCGGCGDGCGGHGTGCSCGDDCSGCDGGCTGTSKPADGGCTCGNNCSTSCNNTCKNTCDEACDTGCTTNTAVNLYNSLVAGLNKKILAADLKNINAMIQSEAKRRSKSTTSQTFTAREKATSAKIKALQDNLKTIGHPTSKDASQKVKSFKATGQELINKTLDAYADTLKHP